MIHRISLLYLTSYRSIISVSVYQNALNCLKQMMTFVFSELTEKTLGFQISHSSHLTIFFGHIFVDVFLISAF